MWPFLLETQEIQLDEKWSFVAKKQLKRSGASRTINTSFLERHHGTDRLHNARKSRKTYRFSKD